MFKLSGFILGGALLFLTGCVTPNSHDAVPQEWSINNPAPHNAAPKVSTPKVPTTNSAAGSGVNQPPPVTVPIRTVPIMTSQNPPPTNMAHAPAPLTTWTSLNHWVQANNLGKPQRRMISPMTTYAVDSPNGEMVVAIGSRDATWNGREIHLGFDPEMIDGEIYLHALDLIKNVAPLLCNKPMAFDRDHVIVIDPGHGGMNSGTISVLDHRPEKEFTLDLAMRLKPLLEQEGWKVYLTRTGDYDMALSNRVNFAEEHHADLFISLHFNSAAPDKKQEGLETYCLTPTGMPSTLTRGYADLWSENLPNNGFDAQNLQLAVRLHDALLRASGEEDRGVRRARFIGVLRGQKRPAILIEGGYLSNPTEAAKIENPDFRQKLAEGIAAALARNPVLVAAKPDATAKPEVVAAQVHTNTIPK